MAPSHPNHTKEIRTLPSLESIYPYFLDSFSGTKEDRKGVTSDLFDHHHHMFLIRPSYPHSSLAEVRIRLFAVLPERKLHLQER